MLLLLLSFNISLKSIFLFIWKDNLLVIKWGGSNFVIFFKFLFPWAFNISSRLFNPLYFFLGITVPNVLYKKSNKYCKNYKFKEKIPRDIFIGSICLGQPALPRITLNIDKFFCFCSISLMALNLRVFNS